MIRLRPAKVADARAIARIHVETWRTTYAGILPDSTLVGMTVDGKAAGWRRNPDAKWRLVPEDIDELIDLQRRILGSAARLVKPGGRLIYATCSLLPRENEEQVAWFLAENAGFAVLPAGDVWREVLGGEAPRPGPYLALTPARDGTDGFFLAVLQRQGKAQA